jgi:hypothetical protein
MSNVKCVNGHEWPDGTCRKCGEVNEQKRRFAMGTRAQAERFAGLNTKGTVFGSGKKVAA